MINFYNEEEFRSHLRYDLDKYVKYHRREGMTRKEMIDQDVDSVVSSCYDNLKSGANLDGFRSTGYTPCFTITCKYRLYDPQNVIVEYSLGY